MQPDISSPTLEFVESLAHASLLQGYGSGQMITSSPESKTSDWRMKALYIGISYFKFVNSSDLPRLWVLESLLLSDVWPR